MLKPIPNIEKTFNIVAQDERQKMVKPVIKTDNVVFQATGAYNGSEYVVLTTMSMMLHIIPSGQGVIDLYALIVASWDTLFRNIIVFMGILLVI